MHDFTYRRGTLCCEDVPLPRIARQFGTPVYVYSHATLRGHYQRLNAALSSVPHLICFSVKSNSNIAILRMLAREGAGFDVVSGGELQRALRAGASPRKIVFAGVGKTEDEIALAVEKQILFLAVESMGELNAIERIARRRRRAARIAIRINPGVDPHTHRYITTGRAENKFGMDMACASEAYARAARMRHLVPIAVQMHIGSQITDTAPYVRAIKKMRPFVRELRGRGLPIRFFDVGGGMGIVYRAETPATARRFASAILPEVRKVGLPLLLEPGRFIAGNAGVLVTRVLYFKRGSVKNFVIVDAAMNDLIRPSLYEAYHEILPVRKREGRRMVADVVGPVCESGDFLGKGRRMHEPREGELLAVMGAGAYGFSMASNYNSRRRAAEVLVHGPHADLVRARERVADLMRGERIPGFLKR